MRVIIRPAAVAYPPKTTMSFSGGNRTAIAKFTAPSKGTATFNTVDLLNILLGKIKGQALPAGASMADLNRACSAIQNQLPSIYTAASVPLATAWGTYCSYCGTVLPGLAEVEHTVPKKYYPTYALDWQNFLLACGPCNNYKLARPTRAIATGWTKKTNPTEAELYNQIRTKHYYWPDLDSGAFTDMRPILQYWHATQNKWAAIPNAQAVNQNNFLLTQDIATRQVTARIFDNAGVPSTLTVRCAITNNGSFDAIDMIDLCGLNDCKTPESTYDRRVFNRTVAWFTGLTAVKHYKAAFGTPHQATFEQMLKYLAMGIGFYDIWISLIWENIDKATAKNFATQLNVVGAYPGSDIAEMFK